MIMGKHTLRREPTMLHNLLNAVYRWGVRLTMGTLMGCALYLAVLAPEGVAAAMGPDQVSVPATADQSAGDPVATAAAPTTTAVAAPQTPAKATKPSVRVVTLPPVTPQPVRAAQTFVPPPVVAADDYRVGRTTAPTNAPGDKVALAKCVQEALDEVPGDPNVRNFYRDNLIARCLAYYNQEK